MSESGEWRRVEELFVQCEGLPDDERAAFLMKTCGDDESLRHNVERLLAADRSVGSRLEGIVLRAVQADTELPTDVETRREFAALGAVPDRIGSYRIGRVVGEGGMGTVFLGERADGTFEQRVAIKLVKQNLLTPDASLRFERERQILARIEHPAVARLLDGGTTPTGMPYLVMEYVNGKAIDAYCDRQGLSILERLRLFRQVCSGVRAAHRNLVVHRDLKPSNILVTPDGQPKLLDFGISKLLDGDGSDGNATLTVLGHRPLTPEYASPEQIRDEPITTAVDVYALGLLLHRLLTGDRPYPLPTTRGEDLRKAICETPAERPSLTVARLAAEDPTRMASVAAARGTVPQRLRRRLRGDLDEIVLKALRKEPKDRYDSAEHLSIDIGRHLEGLPVDARRGGWRYRAGRFLRRNRMVIAAVASVVLALTIGLVGQTREAERANREAERANSEARSSAAVAAFLVELFDAADPTVTREEVTARQLLDRGVERIHGELADQPLVQAHLMSALGRVFHNYRDFDQAEPLFAAALERRQANLPDGHPDIATGHLDLADDLRVQNRLEEAMPHYEAALAMRRAHFGEDSVEFAQILNNMALGWMRAADYDRAADALQRALEIRRRHLGDHMLVAQSLHNLTLIATNRGDYCAAAATGREALELKRRLLPPDDPSLGRTHFELSFPVQMLGDYPEAERLIVQALEILSNAWDDSHESVLMVRGDLAYLRHLRGDWDAAEISQREILQLKQEHLGHDHREVAFTLHSLGRQLQDRGDFEDAEDMFRRSLELRTRIYPESHPNVATARHHLGSLLLQRGRVEEAEPLLRRALAVRRQALPPSHPRLAESLVAVAELLLGQGSPDAAEPLAEEALSILHNALPADHPRVAQAEAILGACMQS